MGFFGQVPHLSLALIRLSIHNSPADIRPVTIDIASSIHQNDISFFEFNSFDAAVGIGGGLGNLGPDSAAGSQSTVSGRGNRPEIASGHSCFQPFDGSFVGFDRDIVGPLHQRNFLWRLDHTASNGDGIGADIFKMGRFFSYAVKEKKPNPFFESDVSIANTPIRKNFGHSFVRTFMLFPCADISPGVDQLMGSVQFESRADPGDFSFCR